MISQDVTIPVADLQMPAYLARPDQRSGPHPAVIVLQEVFGLTPEVRRITDLLPSIGYVALAINYYHRTNPHLNEPYTEEGNRNAFAVAANVTAEQLTDDVRAAVQWLNAQTFVRAGKIATWGFGFGATAAFIASSLAELSGAICFYPANVANPMPGGYEPPINGVHKVAVPLLLVFGQKDYYVSRFDMDRIHRALNDAGKDFRMQIYPNVGHSFFRHGRPEAIVEVERYSDEAIAQAVADAWNLVQVFLRDVFSGRQAGASASGDTHKKRTESIRR
jgi:carboxymethylenebutenolidase